MNSPDTPLWPYFVALFVGLVVVVFLAVYFIRKPRLEYAPLPIAKPARSDDGVPWFMRPLYSRGSYSPRLTMAWQAFYFTCFLTWKIVEALTNPKGVTTALTQNASLLVQIIFGFVGLIVSLMGMGTFQKVKLGDLSPSPGEVETDAANPATPGAPGTTSA